MTSAALVWLLLWSVGVMVSEAVSFLVRIVEATYRWLRGRRPRKRRHHR